MKKLHADCVPLFAGLVAAVLALFIIYPMAKDGLNSAPDRMIFIELLDQSGTGLSAQDQADPRALNRLQMAADGFKDFAYRHTESGFSMNLFDNTVSPITTITPGPILLKGLKQNNFAGAPESAAAEYGDSKFDLAVEAAVRDIDVVKPEHEHRVLIVVPHGDVAVDKLKVSDKLAAKLAKDEVSLYFVQAPNHSVFITPDQSAIKTGLSHILGFQDKQSFTSTMEDIYAVERKEADAQSKTKQVLSAMTVILMTAFLLLFLLGFLCIWGLFKCRRRKASCCPDLD
ncbi:MAG TPA: hypothetical protein V6C89_14975 [Drouetiella sp.]